MNGSSVELNCADYDVKAASMGHGRGGAIFRCTVSPLSDELLQKLDEVARSNGTVRFVFSKRPLLLERVRIERIDVSSARISGRVVEGPS